MARNGSDVSKSLRKNEEISTKAPRYRVAGVQIDPVQASVRRGGEQILLRPKTYRFLLYLIENHNRVVTKEELIERVWEGASVSDGVLVRSVLELRKAFRDDAKDANIIKTFPKLGYGLMAPVEVVPDDPAVPSPSGEPPRAPRLRASQVVAVAIAIPVLLLLGTLLQLRWNKAPSLHPYREAAWWKLQDARGRQIPDSSGNRAAGTLSEDPHLVPGETGRALWFDGYRTEIAGSSDALPSGNSPRTITAWFKTALPHVDQGALFNYGSEVAAATAERMSLYLRQDGRLNFAGGIALTSKGQWADGNWHFVAASYDGPTHKTGRIFVDGQLESEQQFPAEPATVRNASWRIGSFLFSGASFRGAMSDVRVYPFALRPAVVSAIHRCSSAMRDTGEYYYLPIFSDSTVFEERGSQDLSTPFRNYAKDVGGIQLARVDNGCGLAYLEGADAGQDLKIAADLMAPLTDEKKPTIAGPYFRSRLAAPGDGLIGGTSAGYWVQLSSDGMVKIKRLNPWTMVAFSAADPSFDPAAFHHLEVEARGEILQVSLDGKVVAFDQGGRQVTQVQIPSTWLGPPAVGKNQGAAGIAFGTMDTDRGLAGGQRVRNLQVKRLASR